MADEFEHKPPDLGHPDSCIRLASAVHRFRVPQIFPSRSVSFVNCFATVGRDPKTRAVLQKADAARSSLSDALKTKVTSHERVVVESKKYLPLINQILLTCKVQPETARLDERLVFEWASGIEQQSSDRKDARFFASEALMYDMVMCIACEGLGKAGAATEASLAGEFSMASRDHAAAAGIFQSLAEDQLPQWIARGSSVDEDELPIEATVGACKAFSELFLANGQQMAVAMVLIKPGTPNYSLLSKLSRGIVERLEGFMMIFRKEAFDQMSRMDKDFFSLIAFQTQLHTSLTSYFHARHLWEKAGKYGLAIAVMSQATVALKTRSHTASVGMPELKGALQPLSKDLTDLQSHMGLVLKTWEDDNSAVYFEGVPQKVPAEELMSQAVQIVKPTPYKVAEADPLLLSLPSSSLSKPSKTPKPPMRRARERSDSDLARELQDKLNAGWDEAEA